MSVFCLLRYFFITFSFFFFNLKNKVVYYEMGQWILFYLTRQSCNPSTRESEDYEAKN